MELFKAFGNNLLFWTTPIVLGASLLLTIKTRFVQFRKIPQMFYLFFSLLFKRSKKAQRGGTVQAGRALFTAMSTTIGISTIVSPVIAIRLGGPGAMLGFLLATILGAAVNFTEVTLALTYRKHNPEGGVSGGPMQYLQDEIAPLLAKWYAFFGFILLLGWTGAQANQLAAILSTEVLGIPHWGTGLFLAVAVLLLLVGGIKRIASFSAKLVPFMFVVFLVGSLWIIGANLDKIPAICSLVLRSAFTPQSFAPGFVVGGIFSAIRWGVFKGLQSNEAGVGTQGIPHSMANTEGAVDQGVLAMIATYSAGMICLLSSLVALITETWQDPTLPLGIAMVAKSFQSYFSTLGLFIVALSAFLFAFGTILGNSFNGSQCFLYLTKRKGVVYYYFATALLIFFGSIVDVTMIWSVIDFLLVPVVVPHILSVVYLAFKRSDLLVEPNLKTLPELLHTRG